MTPDSDIFRIGGTATTNAAANTINNTNIIAAPGVGFRLRIYSITVSLNQNATGDIQARFDDGGGVGDTVGLIGATSGNTGFISFYPQGVPLFENSPLVMRDRCSAAAQGFVWAVTYRTEPSI